MTIVATIHKLHQENMTRNNNRTMTTVTPRNGTYRDRHAHSGRGSDSDDSSSTGRDWKGYKLDLEEEIQRMKETVETLRADAETHRLDVIERSQRNVECDTELYKRIGDYTKQTHCWET
jgi:hypothetical protein